MDTPQSDTMYAKVLLMLDGTECSQCKRRAELIWAWDRVAKLTIIDNPAAAASVFTESAVAHLKETGWRMIGDAIYCPECAEKRGAASNGVQVGASHQVGQ